MLTTLANQYAQPKDWKHSQQLIIQSKREQNNPNTLGKGRQGTARDGKGQTICLQKEDRELEHLCIMVSLLGSSLGPV